LLARDVIAQVDADLIDVPRLSDVGNAGLLAVLDNGRTALRALHGYEALAGMLIPDAAHGVTAASIAMSALAEARAEDVDVHDLTRRNPVVLALTPPRVGPDGSLQTIDLRAPAGAPSAGAGETSGTARPIGRTATPLPDTSGDAVVREALRLRARWVQELTARAAWELGRRLVAVGVLPSQDAVRLLDLAELREAALRRAVPGDVATRVDRTADAHPLPAQFRLTADGRPVAVVTPASSDGGVGAGGGVGSGPAHLGGDPAPGSVLVVTHLDPRLATVIPRLAGLVAETGSPLSHLAILAREHHVPTVVGHAGATTAYREGQVLEVDGTAGTVRVVGEPATTSGWGEPGVGGAADRPTVDLRARAGRIDLPAPVHAPIPASTPVEIGVSR
jgi:pyruvate,water dikinase